MNRSTFGLAVRPARRRTELATGLYRRPDVSNARLNKDSLSACAPVNGRVRYQATGHRRGFDADLIWVGKADATGDERPDHIAQSRVDLHHRSLVLNYPV